MKIPNKGSLIEVKWIDAFNPDPRWILTGTIKKKSKFKVLTAGYLVDATDDYMILSRDKANRQRGGLFYVPMGCIKNVRRLK